MSQAFDLKKMLRLLVYAVIFFISLFVYVKYLESRSIFFPAKQIEFTPKAIGLEFEDIFLSVKDGIKINGWFIPYHEAKYTIFFCHGNAGNISDRIDKIALLHDLRVNLFIIDYRGYGRSEGKPLENGIYLDAKAGYDYLVDQRKIKQENIVLYGESLGSAVTIDLASKVKIGALITEGAFSSGRDMARRIYPFLPAFIFFRKFDSLSKITNVEAPKLFIHSRDDEVVPFVLAEKLYRSAKEPKRFQEISGGHNHGFLESKAAYSSSIALFIQGL